jgi:hypothetical protein
LALRCLWNFAHRLRCAAPIFLRAAADILRLLPFRVGTEFVEDSSRIAEITLSSFFSSFRVRARSVRNVFLISAVPMVAIQSDLLCE